MRARYSVTAWVGRGAPAPVAGAELVSGQRRQRGHLLLDDLGDAEELAIAVGRVGEHVLLRQRRALDVVPHHVGDRHRVGRGLHVAGVERAQLVDVGEDPVELAPHPLLVGADSRGGRVGPVVDFRWRFSLRCHRRFSSASTWLSHVDRGRWSRDPRVTRGTGES